MFNFGNLWKLIWVFLGLLLLDQASAQSGSDGPEPKCYSKDIDGWVEGNQNYTYDNGFSQRSLKDDCKTQCLKLKSNLFGLVKNGPSAQRGKCYCGNNASGEVGRRSCIFKCGVSQNITCGGNGNLMSVYTTCPPGTFGVNCSSSCPPNCHGNICSVANGHCPQCPRGWYNPPFCDSKCSENCKDNNCNSSGHCLACHDDESYGHDCETSCSEGCTGRKCYVENGTCRISCNDGRHGLECNNDCSDKCQDRDCDRFNGACIECDDKSFYGDGCDQPCSGNCAGQTCKISGECQSCPREWHGPWCNNSCSENCKEKDCEKSQCSNGDSSCDAVTGKCHYGCQAGWTGDTCQQEQRSNILLIVGILLGILALIGIGVMAVFWFIEKKKRKREEDVISAIVGETDDLLEPPIIHDVQTDDEKNIYGNVTSLAMPSKDFPQYVKNIKKKTDFYTKEYKRLPQKTLFPWEAATQPEVTDKNRYKDIYPYDYNRVVLEVLDEDITSDYINASYIKAYSSNFVAAAAPTSKTVNDFWRMIWERDMDVVVMLTNVTELGKKKCEQYWPENVGSSIKFGSFNVILSSEDVYLDYTVRNLTVRKGNEQHRVMQWHFTVWPDHGVPPDATALLNFRGKVREQTSGPMNKPVLIHCSAGVGRTGTYIALDTLIDQADIEKQVDIFNCVRVLRKFRKHIIQTKEQYQFVYEALVEYLSLGKTLITLADFSHQIQDITDTGQAQQYQVLQELAPSVLDCDKEYPLGSENRDKNIDPSIIPKMASRAILKSPMRGRNDYINAVFVNSFRKRDSYIVTQVPLQNTAVDLWRLVMDYQCKTIVTILTKQQAQNTGHFLPEKDPTLNIGGFSISVVSETSRSSYRVLELQVLKKERPKSTSRSKPDENVYANMEPPNAKILQSRSVNVYQLYVPDGQECFDARIHHDLMYDMNKKTNNDSPILVMCYNGATYSGQYVAHCNTWEMIQTHHEVDVFQVAKYIRDRRPEFIGTMEQFVGLYSAAQLYLAQFNTYAV